MKVLFVNLVYGTGSTGKIIADIMNLLKKYGNDVKALYGTGACSDNADTVKVSGNWAITFTTQYHDSQTMQGYIPGLRPER
jgi:hypothetical protein